MRSILLLLLFMVGVAAAWFATSPRRAVDELREAADAGDVARLERIVDFDAVRHNLRADARAAIAARVGARDDEQQASFGVALGGALVDGLVNGLVTPATIAAVTRGRDPRGRAGTASPEESAEPRIDWRSPNRFVARFGDRDAGFAPALEFTRSGLRWRLTHILLPR